MTPVYLDFESYWSTTHSLSRMAPTEYVMHPDTEIQSLAMAIGGGPVVVVFGEADIRALLQDVPWDDAMAIGHNMSGFDAMILAWRFGVRPKMWGCTAAMARSRYSKTLTTVGGKPMVGVSLKKIAAELGVGAKLDLEATNTKGKKLRDFTPSEIEDMRVYNKVDTELCRAAFIKLAKGFPQKELLHIDMTTRMLVEPQFLLDYDLVRSSLEQVKADKKAALEDLYRVMHTTEELVIAKLEGRDIQEDMRTELASAPKFAELLRSRGVDVPMKPSPTNPAKQTQALAKTDEAFLALQDHEDPVVAAAARCRLQVKSTLLETRLEAFIRAADACGGKIPVPLKYAGADTTGRWSGEQYNMQNLSRIDPSKPKPSDALRKSLKAGRGKKVIVADLSGIELRTNLFLWQVPYAMELFQRSPDKADPYRHFAANELYHVEESAITKAQRQVGKLCLAEGTPVLTDAGLVPIEQVSCRHRVWDGVEWVNTDGACYMGEKEVITYDGLTATPDHEVWTADGRKVPLGAAAAQLLRLMRTGDGGAPLGVGGTRNPSGAAQGGAPLRHGTVHPVRASEIDQLRQLAVGEDARVPELQPEVRGTALAASPDGGGAAAVPEPQRQVVQAVRGAGHRVPVSVGGECGGVGHGEPGPGEGQGAGPQGQQRALRAGKPAVADAPPEHRQPGVQPVAGVPPVSAAAPGDSVCGQHAAQPVERGADVRADHRAVQPPVGAAKGRVWDLLNCGPRHRFTAADILVSNCHLGLGFGAGAVTFQKVAKLMGGVTLDLAESQRLVDAYRASHKEVATGWRTCHDALPDILDGHERAIDPWGLCITEKEAIRLPSGRRIHYPDLRRQRDDNGKLEWWYGNLRTSARIYAGKIDENLVQALARDVIADAAVEFRRRTGLTPALMVHDELVYVVDEGRADDRLAELQAIMRTPPAWWPELVTWSEGDVADTYGEAK